MTPVKRVLITGLRDVHSGKTTLGRALLVRIREAGAPAVPFKPWSATDAFVFHDALQADLDAGRLASLDARRLLAASGAGLSSVDVNPVHRVWAPLPALQHPRQRSAPVLDRVHHGGETTMVVQPGVELPEDLAPFLEQADCVLRPEGVAEANDLVAKLYVPAVTAARDALPAEGWRVTESYADMAAPPGLPVEADVILAAEPGRAHRFDADRYRQVLELQAGLRAAGGLEVPMSRVVEMLRPERSVALPNLPVEVRENPARVAEAYASALAALVPELRDLEA